MNPKITRVLGEIDKTKARIAEAQARLRDLERQKVELENAELVAAMRGMKATPQEFEAFLAARRVSSAPMPEQAADTQFMENTEGDTDED
jgi:hypothetical protein